MEKNKPLIKDAKPGEMTIRTSITKPDITGPASPDPSKISTREALKLKDAQPPRRPFSDD